MAEYYGTPLVPPRIAPFWEDVKARLATARMETVLGGAGRIYLAAEQEEPDPGSSGWWARIVITPITTPFLQEDMPGREMFVPWLIVAETHKPTGMVFNPTVNLEAIQLEAFQRLHGWIPGLQTQYNGRLPVIRATPPQPLPLYDEEEDVWYTSSQFEALLSPVEESYP